MTKLDRSFILSVLRNNDQLLAPAQHKICLPILNRIYKKMIHGLKFDDIKVYENLIIDGHHRYLASILSEVPLDQAMSSKTIATIEFNWQTDVDFVEEEWDTKEKILILNRLDAEFNNIPLQEIVEMTK